MLASLNNLSSRESGLIIKRLPNGLTYYIQRHPSPAKRAMLWLAVNAGSLQEDDDQLGFAHFLEHMAFNGTKNFPGLGVVEVMEKAGMNFGADVNAYTSFDETVYQLTVPTDDSIVFRDALQIIQDWASGDILNDSLAVVEERGVVIGEWRARFSDSMGVNALRKKLERTFGKDSRYPDRLPIGDPAQLQTATPAGLKRFYHDWYRPDLMAVIAVGDFDPEQVEREIVRRFGNIPAAVNPRSFERTPLPAIPNTKVEVTEVYPAPLFDIMWPITPPSEDPKQAIKDLLIEQLAFPYLQNLATTLSKQENRPFSLALVGRTTRQQRPIAPRHVLRVIATADSLLPGARVMLTEIERVAQHGMPDSALKRNKALVLRKYTDAVTNASNYSSRSIADRMKHHFLLRDIPMWTADSALKLVNEILPTITSSDIAAFAQKWRTDHEREVKMHAPPRSWMSFIRDTAIFAMLDSVKSQKLAALPAVNVPAANGSGGSQAILSPGKITSVQILPNSDVRIFTLSNGARAVFKPTWTKPDEVIINAHSPGGHSLLPDSLWFSPARLVATIMTTSGGLGGTTQDELATTGIRQFSVGLNTFSEEIVARGAPSELEAMFRMMHLQFVNPTVDTAAFSEWRQTGMRALRLSHSDQLTAIHGGHHRFKPPHITARSMNVEQAMNVYRDRFGDASDFTFYIVGATDSAAVVPLIERYIANLPSTHRSTPETPRDFKTKLPVTKSVINTERALRSSEMSGMSLVFRGSLSIGDEESVTSEVGLSNSEKVGPSEQSGALISSASQLELQTLSLILSRRLRQTLREEMGVTYSVGAPVIFYRVPDLRYAVTINLLTSPSMIDTSSGVVWDVIHSLQAEGPTDQELEIARTILTRRMENAQQSNQWWISQLIESTGPTRRNQSEPDVTVPLFTRDQIQAAANKYLSNTVYSQQTIKPLKPQE